jgi:hypothetical protein
MAPHSDLLPDISFAGCGFLGIYHIGVAAALLRRAPHLLQQRVLGSSIGAITGVVLVGGVPLAVYARDLVRIAEQARQAGTLGAFHPTFPLARLLRESCLSLLPEDIHLRATGRLQICCSSLSGGWLLRQFGSKREVVEAIGGSAFIPGFSGWLWPRFQGHLVLDGGIFDNLPVSDRNTITVSPFAGSASICPPGAGSRRWIPHGLAHSAALAELSRENLAQVMRVITPLGPRAMELACQDGYRDAVRFLERTGHYRCLSCRWRDQVGAAACLACRRALQEAAAEGLPGDIRAVFREEEAVFQKEERRRGGPYSVTWALMAMQLLALLVPRSSVSLSIGQFFPTLVVEIEVCPFGYPQREVRYLEDKP